jgi:hypothetical protein
VSTLPELGRWATPSRTCEGPTPHLALLSPRSLPGFGMPFTVVGYRGSPADFPRSPTSSTYGPITPAASPGATQTDPPCSMQLSERNGPLPSFHSDRYPSNLATLVQESQVGISPFLCSPLPDAHRRGASGRRRRLTDRYGGALLLPGLDPEAQPAQCQEGDQAKHQEGGGRGMARTGSAGAGGRLPPSATALCLTPAHEGSHPGSPAPSA